MSRTRTLWAGTILLAPAAAHAHSAGGGTAIVGTLLGLPLGLTLLVLAIVSAVLGKRTADPRPGRARYGRGAAIASLVLAAVQIVLVALVAFLEFRLVKGATAAVGAALAVFGAPVLVLAVVSFLLARRVARNHAPGQAQAKE